jgi:hypothetical protein
MSDGISDALEAELAEMRAQREVLDEGIARREAALAALHGDYAVNGKRRRPSTAGTAILAALTTFKGPVTSTALLDHESLTHYSRHTLRSALSELTRSGRLTPLERGPHGFIWAPPQ